MFSQSNLWFWGSETGDPCENTGFPLIFFWFFRFFCFFRFFWFFRLVRILVSEPARNWKPHHISSAKEPEQRINERQHIRQRRNSKERQHRKQHKGSSNTKPKNWKVDLRSPPYHIYIYIYIYIYVYMYIYIYKNILLFPPSSVGFQAFRGTRTPQDLVVLVTGTRYQLPFLF